MNQDVKKQWVAALRSGSYAQGRGSLKKSDLGGDSHCCLGVLCDLHSKSTGTKWDQDEFWRWSYADTQCELPETVVQWAGLEHTDPRIKTSSLISMNDRAGSTFEQIAVAIEENL